MHRIRSALAHIAQEDIALRAILAPLTKQADKWKSLPKGWTQESVEKFWSSLTGENKHKVTKCIERMDGKVTDPGAFCASLADKVMGPEWRSKKAMQFKEVMTSTLPAVLKKVLMEVRSKKRKIYVNIDTTFSMYSAGDDGNRGFTAVVDIDTNQYSITWGAFGGGALGQKPSPVDDVKTSRKPLPDHLVIVKGQYGGAAYASITCTDKTFARLTGAGRQAGYITHDMLVREAIRQANSASAFINGKTTALAKHIYGQVKDLKASYQTSPDIPSNIGGFIIQLFEALGNMAAFHALNSLFGNRSDMGSGFGSERTLLTIAHGIAGKVNEAEAVAIGILLIKAAKRPRAAAAFEAWAAKNINMAAHDPTESAAGKVLRPGDAFEATITPEIKGLVAWAWPKVGKSPASAETLAYWVAENVNWHSLRSVVEHQGIPEMSEMVATISQKLGYGLEDVAAFIVALLRVAGLKPQAEGVKKEALAEFTDYYQGEVARVAAATPAGAKKEFERYKEEHPKTTKTPKDFYTPTDKDKDSDSGKAKDTKKLHQRIDKMEGTEFTIDGDEFNFDQGTMKELKDALKDAPDIHGAIEKAWPDKRDGDWRATIHKLFDNQQDDITEKRHDRKVNRKAVSLLREFGAIYRVATRYLQRVAASPIGKTVYLNRKQTDLFRVNYTQEGTKLVIAADALLKSNPEYDHEHVQLLKPLGGKTLLLQGQGHGWFTIQKVQ